MSIFKNSILVAAVTCVGLATSGPSAVGQRASTDVAWTRARSLEHGINASLWFAQSRDYTIERLRSFTTEDDVALMDFVQPSMRAAWLHDMSSVLHRYGIGWATWDYQANFDVVSKANGVTTPNRQILEALGLQLKPDDSVPPGEK